MYVDNAMVAVLGLMGLVSLLNWGFILISIIYNRSTGVAQTTTDVEDVTFTSSVNEQKQRKKHTCVSCKHQYYSRYSGNKPQCQSCRSWRDTTMCGLNQIKKQSTGVDIHMCTGEGKATPFAELTLILPPY